MIAPTPVLVATYPAQSRPPARGLRLADLPKATMNRFLQRKKTKDDSEDGPDSGKKGSKKGKKGQLPPKPELDLTIALPPADNFRTSLIMPSLSTRFSMLREQDDPTSKLGKASDDSVLQPKRQSRLQEFGFRPGVLGDIAEVSSINGSTRNLSIDRQGSVDGSATLRSDDGTQDGGSIMSRARPGEGNVLFGGRQKIYMIPANGSTNGLGKALYDDDVGLSAFQKYRKREKEEAVAQGYTGDAQETREQEPLEQPGSTREPLISPSVSEFSQRRQTTSSDTSAPSITRTSTAATSITSQTSGSTPISVAPSTSSHNPMGISLDRSVTKTRRLYEQGLNQQIHDQQHSAINRLNSLQRGQPSGRATPPLFQAKSATSLNERFNRQASFRTASPTLFATPTTSSSKDVSSAGSSPALSCQSPPLSPTNVVDENGMLASALSPSDRGKATAMGAFNRPKQQYDENQHVQRLQNLQQGRESPSLRRDPPSNPQPSGWAPLNTARKMSEPAVQPRSVSRERSPSNASSTNGPSAFSVFQRAASQMRAAVGDAPESSPSTGKTDTNQRTFFASPDDSEDEIDRKARAPVKTSDLNRRLQTMRRASPSPNRPAPPLHEHPALRSYNSHTETIPEVELPKDSKEPVASVESPELKAKQPPEEVDSPTLGADNGGLSGLVRAHLRNVSNVSSVYTEAPPPPESLALRTRELNRKLGSESDTPAHSSYSHSNPWDLEDFEGGYYGEADSFSSASPVDSDKPKIRSSNDAPRSHANAEVDGPASGDPVAPWEQEKSANHNRNASTETQRERDAIAKEMRRRQKAIEEKLGIAPKDDDSQSELQNGPFGARKALNMLRTRPSRDSVSMPGKLQDTSKAFKMLGLGITGTKSELNVATYPNQEVAQRKEFAQSHDRLDQVRTKKLQSRPSHDRPSLERPSNDRPSHERPSQDQSNQERPSQERSSQEHPSQDRRRPSLEPVQRPSVEENSSKPQPFPSLGNRSPPSSTQSSIRQRSSSEVSSGRSRSRTRTGRYRDDLDRAMAEGTGSSTSKQYAERSPIVPQHILEAAAQRPTTEYVHPAERARGRAGSKSEYFDQSSLHPALSRPPPLGVPSPHLSPSIRSQPAFSPGLPPSPRPSPGPVSPGMFMPRPSPIAAYSANSTPPISNPTTPVPAGLSGSSTTSISAGPSRAGPAPRKKSINKSDISEPTLISKTSNVDVRDLPAGASLKNGMAAPPPIPPINPRRRRFGFGRGEGAESQVQSTHSSIYPTPQPPFLSQRSQTQSGDEGDRPREPRKLRKTSSEGHSLRAQASQAATGSSPALPQHGFAAINTSPPRPTAEGVMF